MNELHYQPGSWNLIATESAVMLYPTDVDRELLVRSWDALKAGANVGQVIELVSASCHHELGTIPPFALAVLTDGGVHSVVRGNLSVSVMTAQGPELVTGEVVTTWSERFVAEATGASVHPLGAENPDPTALTLPIEAGVVQANWLQMEKDGSNLGSQESFSTPAARKVSQSRSRAGRAARQVGTLPEASMSAAGPTGGSVRSPKAKPTTGKAVPKPSSRPEPAAFEKVTHPPTVEPALDAVTSVLTPVAAERSSRHSPSNDSVSVGSLRDFLESSGVPEGDHDGSTLAGSGRSGSNSGVSATSLIDMVEPPQVLALICPRGHSNPPHSPKCRACEEPLTGEATLVPRPALGRISITNGDSYVLDRSVVVGRRPRIVHNEEMPPARLVAVESPEQDISRNHVEILLDGWHVLATDLESKNGTTLLRSGQAPIRLTAAEPTLVQSHDVLDLGDGVKITFIDLP